ncbi:MAG: hypothetical protein RIB98_06045 [Acidimicrobiales bacterium]
MALLRLAGPVVALAAAQGVFGVAHVNGAVTHGSIEDYAFTLAFGGAAIAAIATVGAPKPRARTLQPGEGQLVVTWAPLVAWAVASVVSHVSVQQHDGWTELLVLVVGGAHSLTWRRRTRGSLGASTHW